MNVIFNILVYFLIGSIFAGSFNLYLERTKNYEFPIEIVYTLVPIFWPIFIPILLTFGFKKLLEYILFARKDRIQKVVNKLTK